jgi:hypothetical protein
VTPDAHVVLRSNISREGHSDLKNVADELTASSNPGDTTAYRSLAIKSGCLAFELVFSARRQIIATAANAVSSSTYHRLPLFVMRACLHRVSLLPAPT